jgi:hypothetical protein
MVSMSFQLQVIPLRVHSHKRQWRCNMDKTVSEQDVRHENRWLLCKIATCRLMINVTVGSSSLFWRNRLDSGSSNHPHLTRHRRRYITLPHQYTDGTNIHLHQSTFVRSNFLHGASFTPTQISPSVMSKYTSSELNAFVTWDKSRKFSSRD